LKKHPDGNLRIIELGQFGFACPNVSPFCGIKRGVGSDGWRDDEVARSITYRCNDFSVLMSLVNRGLALAYVPDFVAQSLGLMPVKLLDYDHDVQEHVELIYKPSLASGWLSRLTRSIQSSI
jgi:DNA-binding transcriptional LysR family regulator